MHDLLMREIADPDKHMVQSHEGGAVYQASDATKFTRFLIMGSHSTFYANERDLTNQAVEWTRTYIAGNGDMALNIIEKVMRERLAYRRDTSLFALSVLLRHPDVGIRRGAEGIAREYVNTGTDILHLASYLKVGGGWNTLTRRTIGNFFTKTHTPGELALQAVKYEQRDGWTLRDLLRVAHIENTDPDRDVVLDFIAYPDKRNTLDLSEVVDGSIFRLLHGWRALRDDELNDNQKASLIQASRLPREMVPGELLARPDVWAALAESMPHQALVRNLGKLTNVGVITGKNGQAFALRIEAAAKHLHPLQFLLAKKIYEQGRGDKGKLSWRPVKRITDALEWAFYESFGHLAIYNDVKPLIALDVSGSMSSPTNGTSLSCYEAEAALALVLAKQFPNAQFVAFSHQLEPMIVPVPGPGALDRMMHLLQNTPMGGGTDCRLPLNMEILTNRFDAVITMTDSETWAGNRLGRTIWNQRSSGILLPSSDQTVASMLRSIRQHKPTFKNIVCAFQLNDISIADPDDRYALDIAGMSADVPRVIADFLARD